MIMRLMARTTLLFVLLHVGGVRGHAQGILDPRSIGWSEAIPLISDEEPDGYLPQLAVDQQGDVHVVWAAWLGNEQDKPFPEALNTFMYRRLSQNNWTPTNDILVAPGSGAFVPGSLVADDQGFLNLTWVDLGRTRSVFLSRAHVSLADVAPAWTTSTVDVPQIAASYPHLVAASGGLFHLVYAKDNRTVVYLSSPDYGETWSNPGTVWSTADPGREAVSNPRIAVDSKGNIHVVWTVNVIERSWQGIAVFYARSIDAGLTWDINEVQRSQSDELTTAWINVAVRNGNEVHLAWNRGIGSLRGRYHSWSSDNGETWGEPVSFFPPNESGQTHWPWMVVDTAGVLHLISKTGAGVNDGAPKYIFWDGSGWSQMYAFSETQNDLDSALAIGLGNTLHFVHAAETGSGQLLYRSRVTGAPALPPQPIPAPELRSTTTPSVALQGEAPANSGRADLERSVGNLPNFDTTQPQRMPANNSGAPVMIAFSTSLLIVVTVLVIRFGSRRR